MLKYVVNEVSDVSLTCMLGMDGMITERELGLVVLHGWVKFHLGL